MSRFSSSVIARGPVRRCSRSMSAMTATPKLVPSPSPWQPQRLNDAPAPPPPDTREEQLAQLAAQEKLGHDGKRQRVRARRTVDPFGGLERWKIASRCSLSRSPTSHADVRLLPTDSSNQSEQTSETNCSCGINRVISSMCARFSVSLFAPAEPCLSCGISCYPLMRTRTSRRRTATATPTPRRTRFDAQSTSSRSVSRSLSTP